MSQIAVYTHSSGPGSGTVTSVSGGIGITITGNSSVNPTVNLTVPVIIANGGTNATSFSNTDGVIYYNGTRLVTTNTGTNGQILTITGGIPTFTANTGGVITLNGDVGSATGDPITITGSTSGAVFTGSGSTLTQSFNFLSLASATATTGYISIGGNVYVSNYNGNNFFGNSGNITTTGTENVAVGEGALEAVTSGGDNTSIGYQTAIHLTTGESNCAVGMQALNHLTSGNQNTSLGTLSSSTAGFNGSNNILVGYEAGISYDTTESSNIIIGNTGTAAESNVIRIGTQGSSAAQQDVCFIAGITGVTTANSNMVTVNTSTGQLGAAAVPIGSLTWNIVTGTTQAAVKNNAYVANNAGTVVITLPATASVGDTILVSGMNNATGWQIAQNSGQVIHYGTSATTTGTGGSLASTNTYDTITLTNIIANTTWLAYQSQGNITVV